MSCGAKVRICFSQRHLPLVSLLPRPLTFSRRLRPIQIFWISETVTVWFFWFWPMQRYDTTMGKWQNCVSRTRYRTKLGWFFWFGPIQVKICRNLAWVEHIAKIHQQCSGVFLILADMIADKNIFSWTTLELIVGTVSYPDLAPVGAVSGARWKFYTYLAWQSIPSMYNFQSNFKWLI